MVNDKGLPDGDPVGRNLFDGTFPLPTAVLLHEALEHNVTTMAGYCADHDVRLAPHVKTTMYPPIVRRQLAAGAWAVTVATAWQAGAVVGMGARRLLLASPVVDPGSLRLLDGLLTTHSDLELWAYADSTAALSALEDGIGPVGRRRVRVLVELGVPGGRTGLRADRDALELARRVAAGPLPLGGVAAFEGILDGGSPDATSALVDALLDRVAGLAHAIDAEGLPTTDTPIVTAGGSAWCDRVTGRLAPAVRGTPWATVLRSGCYVTHDAGVYQDLSPFGAHPREPYRLREALRVWAPVLSRPEPGRVVVGLGRRDASADAGLPVARQVRDAHGRLRPGAALTAVAINDQHLYLDVPADEPVAVGDLVAFGISHPCTTFDKWRAIPIVDQHGTVVEVDRTVF
ncbi:alanine racemase [Micromonospora echinofusca]|uniref:D-serine dehydratase-like domain-containing protein n=1 Tax=Micromonospora echinofusca TaxID=47858 RepID=A0ABS3VTT8_MICEH|nr:alanine racemase [Micromonospora echinofusca]MBO4207950.1 hypothetical protein [Micromonospora echinofusca]